MMFDMTLLNQHRKALMGFAILWITLYHCIAGPVTALGIPVLAPVLNYGWLGVDIFLFLSGIGLYFSMSHNASAGAFYKRRIRRVVIPWLVLSLPYWIIKTMILDGMRFRAMLLNWSGASFWLFGVKSVWYVAFLLVLYALYPLIFRIQKQHPLCIRVLIAGAFVLNIVMLNAVPDYYGKTELAFTRIPVFLFGSLTGAFLQAKPRKKLPVFPLCYLAAMILLFFAGVFLADDPAAGAALMMQRLGGQGTALAVTAGLCLLLNRQTMQPLRKLLDFFGGFTLELYLLHVFLGYFAEQLGFDDAQRIPVQFLVQTAVVVLSVAGAWAFSRLMSRIRHQPAPQKP